MVASQRHGIDFVPMKGSAYPVQPTSKPISSPPGEEMNHQEQIARLAFELWEKDGCAYGREINFWDEAERQLIDGAAQWKIPTPSLDSLKN